MSKIIKIKKGLNIKLKGEAERKIVDTELADMYALKPTDFPGLVPKLTVKQGHKVKAGTPLFFDKKNPDVKFCSPVSGEVVEVLRGERRKILAILVRAESEIEYEKFEIPDLNDRDKVVEVLLNSGLWTFIQQRPYAIVANPKDKPKAIHVSAFDTAPLAPDYEFILKDKLDEFQKGIDVLSKLTEGKTHLNVLADNTSSIFRNVNNVQINQFKGPHPTGNPGIQIHHIDPVNKGDIVWYINPQDVVLIGRLFNTGKYDTKKTIALTGQEVDNPQYYNVLMGSRITELTKNNLKSDNVRHISGNVLTGTKISSEGYLCHYDSQITIIPEGDSYDFFGWMNPGLKRFSTSRSYFAWLMPNKKFEFDTNYHGEERAFVVTGQFEKVLPMDILPMQLIKAIMTEDIDMMENLGIYEIAEEDFALCEFVDTSKTEIQEIIRNGINLMIKEMS